MLSLQPPSQQIAAKLARAQQQTGLEHYWAIEKSGRIYEGSGRPDHVIAGAELEAAYDVHASDLRYHHSHPDERALSPSDLGLLHRSGVREVWAHSVNGASYGAALVDPAAKAHFQSLLDKLHGHMDVELVNAQGYSITTDEFEAFRDLAACEALESRGVIRTHIRLSDAMRRRWLSEHCTFIAIRSYFASVLV
ncbi:MAG TPA: hypothetical protein VGR32_05115 [Brevundimonas sp.]|jgi:hypothetical protein|uniref:hypothetical protein n=1 Tax=Brevundimonas sp. TaxID=1871086 RepID=UPI002DEEA495|nr:hypothetical protein [Brevundimonas sp.]